MAAWACFLLLPFVFYPRPREREYSFFSERYFSTLFIINSVFIITFYYVNTHLVIPKLLDQKKFLSYTLIILALLIFYGFLPRIYHGLFGSLQPQLPSAGRPPRPRNYPLVNSGNIAIFLMVFVFSTGIKVINEWL